MHPCAYRLPSSRSRHGAMLLVISLALAGTWARAAATDITISMAQPPSVPQLHAPASLSARPSSSLRYAVPATGQAPLTFSAQGLPAGLALTATSGVLSGTMPAAGSYPVLITATNPLGSASATLVLVSGDTLSLTPPMGWNSYDSFGGSVTEQETMAAAEALKAHLQPHGWNYVVVDYLWYDQEQVIDANGRYLPSPRRFPSATGTKGFKPLADRVHALGLQFGIHIMRGIPRKSVTAKSPILGTSYTAVDAARSGDACPWDQHMWGVRGDTPAGQAWYDSIFAQYAEWDVDFVKVDDMVSGGTYHRDEVEAIRRAIDKTGRSIVLSLSPGPMQTRDVVSLNANANMWRMVNDFWDKNGLSDLDDEFDAANAWQAVQGLEVGHWPDADMLPLGYLGPRCPVHGPGPTALSHNLQVLVMTLWSILPSPLMFGGNVPALGTDGTGPWTTALLTNEEVLGVNQDGLGARAKRLRRDGSTEVWTRALSGGRKAVALFNRGMQDVVMTVSFSQLGVSGPQVVRDLWHRQEVKGDGKELTATVPHEAALLFTVGPPAPDGGVDAGVDAGVSRDAGQGGSEVDEPEGSEGAEDAGGPAGVPDAGRRSDAGSGPGDGGGRPHPGGDGGLLGGCGASGTIGSHFGEVGLLLGLLFGSWRGRRRRGG